MGPRKRAKRSPAEGSTTSASSTPVPTPTPTPTPSTTNTTMPPSQPPSQSSYTQSWYGSWPRTPKSSASTQVARETILGGTVKSKATADFSRFDTKKTADNMSLEGVPESSAASTMSNHQDSSTNTSDQVPSSSQVVPENSTVSEDTDVKMGNDGQEETNQSTEPQIPTESEPIPPPPPPPSSGWLGPLGWFGRPAANPEPTVSGSEETKSVDEPAKVVQSEEEVPSPAAPSEQPPPEAPEVPNQPEMQERPVASSGYWFGFWSSSGSAPPPPPTSEPEVPAITEPEVASEPAKDPEDVVMQDAPSADNLPTPPPKAGSTWAFWSRDTGSSSGKRSSVQAEPGQLAVIGEGSESHPQRANSIDIKDTASIAPSVKLVAKEDKAKGAAAILRESSSSAEASAKGEQAVKPVPPKTPTSAKVQSPPNLLLPSFSSTYKMKENPSIIQQITQLILRSQQPQPKHLFLSKEQPKVRKAIAIGVHGLVPANYLRTVIGQPTGTSIKFANHCAEAIRRWADSHGCEDCEIEKVALEGEGRIAERVENLWKLLLNWIDHIRNADLIVFACHSQGVPVTIMLLSKLIDLGIITTARVGICSMAGVSLGPFPDYRSSMGMLMGSAAQLWEFADPESEVSKRLETSVKAVLSFGTRITYIGSIDDQLVPLESAIYAPAHHPYIYRAVFIDGRIHTPDFIAHLVGFALKLRNLGVTDHGLIRELSTPLAGSLYSGEGHSRLYDDEQVYDLAVSHALETTSIGNVPCEIHKHQGLTTPNPYHLPWIMRGLLEEEFVKSELTAETAELLEQFDDWKPVTKALKDVKYRLEAVRSKL
ncbi:hypothetical protein B0T17DRAFT_533251 [Bombardia bombarda]|uniref:YMC020W-like alpha/beta hydrolase domain-containing protein n=1 Tax=Bombardia bombarda TaxID=252184 RepID=A0AA40C176_9PEZI|nr:hypothetical protein B0T17DRAFT_533251 [Bombardia bombarda]